VATGRGLRSDNVLAANPIWGFSLLASDFFLSLFSPLGSFGLERFSEERVENASKTKYCLTRQKRGVYFV
jgi:hypothetical protein